MKNSVNFTKQGLLLRVSNKLDNGQSLIDVKLEDGSVKQYMTETRRIPLAKGLFSFYEGLATKNCWELSSEKVAYCNIEPKLMAMGIISTYEIKDYLQNN